MTLSKSETKTIAAACEELASDEVYFGERRGCKAVGKRCGRLAVRLREILERHGDAETLKGKSEDAAR